MRMPAKKQLGGPFLKLGLYLRGVFTRIPADMGHKNTDFLALPPQFFRVLAAHVITVNIAINPFQRLKRLQGIGNSSGSKVAGMPDLVATLKMAENRFVQKTMGIRYKSNPGHNAR